MGPEKKCPYCRFALDDIRVSPPPWCVFLYVGNVAFLAWMSWIIIVKRIWPTIAIVTCLVVVVPMLLLMLFLSLRHTWNYLAAEEWYIFLDADDTLHVHKEDPRSHRPWNAWAKSNGRYPANPIVHLVTCRPKKGSIFMGGEVRQEWKEIHITPDRKLYAVSRTGQQGKFLERREILSSPLPFLSQLRNLG